MKKVFFLVISMIVLQVSVLSQQNVKENVYLHLNSSYLITGETLRFSAFVMSSSTQKPSPLSSILYIELISTDDQSVFQAKIPIKDGLGQGEFFINSLINSGKYHLIAYTRWMKNFDDIAIYPITIINPFERYESPNYEDELKVQFLPKGGKIYANTRNYMTMIVESNDQRDYQIEGRLVDGDGETITNLSTNDLGIGWFSFEAHEGKTYKAILEDSVGGFLFFDLPATSPEPIFNVNHNNGLYINAVSGLSGSYKIKVYDNQNIYLEESNDFQRGISIDAARLPKTPINVQIFNAAGVKIFEQIHVVEYSPLIIHKKPEFQTRQMANLNYQIPSNSSISVSIRKTNPFGQSIPSAVDAQHITHLNLPIHWDTWFSQNINIEHRKKLLEIATYKYANPAIVKNIKFLPETRGEIVEGSLSADSQIGVLSFPGKTFQLSASDFRNDDGRFSFLIDSYYQDRTMYLTDPKDPTSSQWSISNPFLEEYPSRPKSKLDLDSAEIAYIIDRSVNNQIANAYLNSNTKKSLEPDTSDFIQNFDFFYLLDDYNRFPKLQEIFVEYMPMMSVRKAKKVRFFNIPLEYPIRGEDKPVLVLLDGVPITAEEVLNINPYLIKSVGIINKRFWIGPLVADGVVSFQSFETEVENLDYVKARKVIYKGLQAPTKFDTPDYSSLDQPNIPDMREQLYWNPSAEVNEEGILSLDFSTSNLTGEYEVSIQGFTSSGEPISVYQYFIVNDDQ